MAGAITVSVDPDVVKVNRLASKSECCQPDLSVNWPSPGIHDHAGGGLDASKKPPSLNFRMHSGRVCGPPGRTDTVTGACANAYGQEA